MYILYFNIKIILNVIFIDINTSIVNYFIACGYLVENSCFIPEVKLITCEHLFVWFISWVTARFNISSTKIYWYFVFAFIISLSTLIKFSGKLWCIGLGPLLQAVILISPRSPECCRITPLINCFSFIAYSSNTRFLTHLLHRVQQPCSIYFRLLYHVYSPLYFISFMPCYG